MGPTFRTSQLDDAPSSTTTSTQYVFLHVLHVASQDMVPLLTRYKLKCKDVAQETLTKIIVFICFFYFSKLETEKKQKLSFFESPFGKNRK